VIFIVPLAVDAPEKEGPRRNNAIDALLLNLWTCYGAL